MSTILTTTTTTPVITATTTATTTTTTTYQPYNHHHHRTNSQQSKTNNTPSFPKNNYNNNKDSYIQQSDHDNNRINTTTTMMDKENALNTQTTRTTSRQKQKQQQQQYQTPFKFPIKSSMITKTVNNNNNNNNSCSNTTTVTTQPSPAAKTPYSILKMEMHRSIIGNKTISSSSSSSNSINNKTGATTTSSSSGSRVTTTSTNHHHHDNTDFDDDDDDEVSLLCSPVLRQQIKDDSIQQQANKGNNNNNNNNHLLLRRTSIIKPTKLSSRPIRIPITLSNNNNNNTQQSTNGSNSSPKLTNNINDNSNNGDDDLEVSLLQQQPQNDQEQFLVFQTRSPEIKAMATREEVKETIKTMKANNSRRTSNTNVEHTQRIEIDSTRTKHMVNDSSQQQQQIPGNLSRLPFTTIRDTTKTSAGSSKHNNNNNSISNPKRHARSDNTKYAQKANTVTSKSETISTIQQPPNNQSLSITTVPVPTSNLPTADVDPSLLPQQSQQQQQQHVIQMKLRQQPLPPRIITSGSHQQQQPEPQKQHRITSTNQQLVTTTSSSNKFATPYIETSKTKTNVMSNTNISTNVNPTYSMLLQQNSQQQQRQQYQQTPALTSTTSATTMTTAGSTNATINSSSQKKGICMDLSDMFLDVAHHTKSSTVVPTRIESLTKQEVIPEVAKDDRITISKSKEITALSMDEMDDQQHWAEKQVDMFTKWMNYLFYPNDDQTQHHDPAKMSTTATTSTALRTLVAHQRMAQGRNVATLLFHSTEMKRIRDIMCTEIGRNKIALRPDRDLYANLEHRNMILSLLLSYSTPWLRIGLETMFQTVILPDTPTLFSPNPRLRKQQNHSDDGDRTKRSINISSKAPLTYIKSTLRQFIIQNILSDDKILAKYTGGKCMVPSGPFEERYRTELRSVVLYRLLVLIVFLDRAKMSNILEQAPNLFTSTSTIKSTREVLLFICRTFLKAEGDFIKHLSRLGIKVQYEQAPVDELDYTVSNLRIDLHDGVRISRMTELLTGASILPKLRLPAVSRLQKLFNVKMAMDYLADAGVPISDAVAPYHIVDGHCEMVLKLLWSVVAHCCMDVLLSVEQVQSEITRIRRYHGIPIPQPTTIGNHDCNDLQSELLQWCGLICSRFGRDINDFTKSFADGKAVCLLIHYYHPTLIRLKEIKMTSHDKLAKYGSPNRLVSNERYNGSLANARMADLGGIPEIIPICDSLHPPEEKAMVFCLTFLCSRLITSSFEIRACILIQNIYRNYRNRLVLVHKVSAAKKIILAWRKNKMQYYHELSRRYNSSVRVIENFICTNREALYKLRLRRLDQTKTNTAAITIQKNFRMLNAVKFIDALNVRKQSAITLQCMWRQELARRLVLNRLLRNDAATIIQRVWFKFKLNDVKKNKAATHIQSCYRGYVGRVQYIIDVLDIIAVQSCARRMLCRRRYFILRGDTLQQSHVASSIIQCAWRLKKSRSVIRESIRRNFAAIVIQSSARKWKARQILFELKCINIVHLKVIRIQSYWRSFQCRMHLQKMRYRQKCIASATAIQSQFRCYKAHHHFTLLKRQACELNASKTIQALWRGWRSRAIMVKIQFAATIIQAATRSMIAVRRLKLVQFNIHLMEAVLTIQCYWRRWAAMQYTETLRRDALVKTLAVTTIQRFWRGFVTKSTFKLVKTDATLIQACYRGFYSRQLFRAKNIAAASLQSFVRQALARNRSKQIIEKKIARKIAVQKATVSLQAAFRGSIVRSNLRKQYRCVTKIQSAFRGYVIKIHYRRSVSRIIKTQSVIRRWLSYRLVHRRQYAIITMQCMIRSFHAKCNLCYLKYLKQQAISEQDSATCIQRIFRGMVARKFVVKEASARKIQKTWRCYTVHVEYMLSILAAIEIQSSLRRFIAVKKYQHKQRAIVCIQSFCRLTLLKVNQRLQKKSAVTLQSFAKLIRRKATLHKNKEEYASASIIQACFRSYRQRSEFVFIEVCILTLQRYVRGYLVRMQIETENFAATEIQRIWLGYVVREYYAWNILGVIRLQSFCRMVNAKLHVQKVRNLRIIEHNLAVRSAKAIQTCFRTFQYKQKVITASTEIQRFVKCYLSRKAFGKVRKGILRAQCLVRGFLTRRKRTKKVIVQARRIGTANCKALAAPKMKLGCRTKDALAVLLRSKSLSEIMDAIVVLEIATRLSEVCCVKFVDAKAPNILFSLIQTCNRSLPHVKLLHCVLRTMANVARFAYLLPSMATLVGIEVFLDLVQMFRDKDFVFCIVVSLLDRIVRSNENNVLSLISKENIKRLKGVRDLCIRKHSIGVSDAFSQRRMSLEVSLPISSTERRRQELKNGLSSQHDNPNVLQGIRRLERIIRLIERQRQSQQPTSPSELQ